MEQPTTFWLLIWFTAGIAISHAILGPDHYAPFIAISNALSWSRAKTAFIVFISGLAHVLSSVVIGGIGLLLGLSLKSLEWFEGTRGEVAGWLLILAGIFYFIWSLRRKYHHHHPEISPAQVKRTVAFWTLVGLFVLGPCEPLIPLMFVAVQISWPAVIISATVFLILTVIMMEVLVLAGVEGIRLIPVKLSHRLGNVVASLFIVALGVALMLAP